MTSLRIHTFGGFHVYRGQELITGYSTRKAERLFCYLILNHIRSHPREVLAEIFWEEQEPKNARHCLNTTLWRLQRVLGSHSATETCLLVERDQIRFNTENDYWLDAEEFEHKIRLAEGIKPSQMTEPQCRALEEAVQLYRGPFLDGYLDYWCLYERERFEQMLLKTLANLMVYHGTKGQYENGIAYGQRILSLDPLREEVHRSVMRYYQLAGRRAEALRQFKVCRRVLREELDIEPMAETTALYRRIRDRQWDAETEMGLMLHTNTLSSQTDSALARLNLALERFDEARGQLSLAVTALEKLLKHFPTAS